MDARHPRVDGAVPGAPRPRATPLAHGCGVPLTSAHTDGRSPLFPRKGRFPRPPLSPRGRQGQRTAPQGAWRRAGTTALWAGAGRMEADRDGEPGQQPRSSGQGPSGLRARGDSILWHGAGNWGLACYGTAHAGHPCQTHRFELCRLLPAMQFTTSPRSFNQ